MRIIVTIIFLFSIVSLSWSEDYPILKPSNVVIHNETLKIQETEKDKKWKELSINFINRGESYLATAKFDEALEDLNNGYKIAMMDNLFDKRQRQQLELRSLVGMMVAYAYLGEEENAFSTAECFSFYFNDWECASCQENYLCIDDVIGPDEEPYDGWCKETVNSTVSVLKGLVNGSRLGGATKASINFALDKLKTEALKCCARGGLWKACVGPLARKLHEWKVFGVPADPLWD